MLNLTITSEGDVNIVYLQGELDAASSVELSKTLLDFAERDTHRIVLDFAEVSYISSNGLKPLLEWLDATKTASGKRKLTICNLQEFVNEVFRITEFDRKFPIFSDTKKALNSFR